MRRVLVALVSTVWLASTFAGSAQSPEVSRPERLRGLVAAAQVWRDSSGIAHIRATNEHDLFFLQGYVHAQDRLFQMDVARRQASGRLAELLGPAAIESDVNTRTLGIRRAAVESVPLLSARTRAALGAYTRGLNLYAQMHPLPPEYGALEVTQFEPWTVLDSVTVAKSYTFGLSFDLADIDYTQAVGSYQSALGPGAGMALFSEDLWRSAPFDPASTLPDASAPREAALESAGGAARLAAGAAPANPVLLRLAREYVDRIETVPFLRAALDPANRPGSNQWAVAGRHTTTGAAMLANDPHLALGTPSTFYPIHLSGGDFDVIGSSLAGVPFVVIGHNRWIAWGATTNPMDVTDVYAEQLVQDGTSPSGYSSLYQGTNEWVIPIPETFRFNQPGDGTPDNLAVATPGSTFGSTEVPEFTLIVPRRNEGPIVNRNLEKGVGLSVQYTGFSGTRELETLVRWNLARGLGDFVDGLQYFDGGAQSFAYADVGGSIAYFTGGELPIREDLQAGTVNGAPPWLIRNGQGGNEWLPVQHPQPGQAIPYEILPYDEMPRLVNPPAGWLVSANNDPVGTTLDNNPLNQLRAGGGIYYLNPGYDVGFRAGRITRLLGNALARGRGISLADMQAIQSDVAMPDAEYFVPWIVQALERARTSGADPTLASLATPAVVEAVNRLGAWDFTAPTGIPEGYDAAGMNGLPRVPTQGEVSASVAATIYSVWRGQFVRQVIDAPFAGLPTPPDQRAMTALRNLLDKFVVTEGVGSSGVNFFPVPGVASAEDRRDIAILKGMDAALARLSGSAFAPAYANSTDQGTYRWGMLHRVVLGHPLSGPFSIPPAGGAFPSPLTGLAGIPTDGGFGAVDASEHAVRAESCNGFMFRTGPATRFVVGAERRGMRAAAAWPGGTSGVLGSPLYVNLLPLWLTNDSIRLPFETSDLQRGLFSVSKFVPR
jgi:penicillin G amidase